MNNVLRDKAWARRFARTSGDLGITHVGPRYRFPIRIWTPTKVPQKARRIPVTVPSPLPASPDACSRVQVGAGRQSPPPTPAVDDDAGWADYMRRAFAGEFEPF